MPIPDMGRNVGQAIQNGVNWSTSPSQVSANGSPLAVGGKYQSLIDANPYRNQTYNKSPWQNFLSALGIRTQADAWQENMNVQAAEYDAAVLQKKFDTEYNDPQLQVARMKAAGLNPDIDPGTIDSGSAAPMGEDPSTPMQSTGEEGQFMGVVNGIFSALTTSVGLVNSLQGIHRNSLQNTILALQGDREISSLADTMSPTFLSPYSEGSDMNPQELIENAMERARLFARGNVPRNFRDKFIANVERFYSSAPGEASAYKSWYDDITAQKDFYHGKNTFYALNPKTLDSIYKHIGSAEEKIWNLQTRQKGSEAVKATTEADYQSSVIEGLNPGVESAARNAEFGARKNEAEVTNILRGAVNGILSDMENDNSELGPVFRLLLRMYSLYMFTR